MPSSVATTGGQVNNILPGAGGIGTWARKCIVERVTGQGASGYLQLTRQLPANSRIVWASINNRNAIVPRAASSAAASNVAIMGVALVYTAPTSLATNAATSNVLLGLIQSAFGATVASNGQVQGLAVSATATGGGLAPTAWQYGIGTTPIRKIWRTTSDDAIEIFPTPSSSGDTLNLSFVTTYWAKTVANVFKGSLSADDDYHLFPDRLFVLGVKWRFLETKGLPFAAPKAEYDQMLGVRRAAARPSRTLSLDSRRARNRRLVDYRNVPDTGFGA